MVDGAPPNGDGCVDAPILPPPTPNADVFGAANGDVIAGCCCCCDVTFPVCNENKSALPVDDGAAEKGDGVAVAGALNWLPPACWGVVVVLLKSAHCGDEPLDTVNGSLSCNNTSVYQTSEVQSASMRASAMSAPL